MPSRRLTPSEIESLQKHKADLGRQIEEARARRITTANQGQGQGSRAWDQPQPEEPEA